MLDVKWNLMKLMRFGEYFPWQPSPSTPTAILIQQITAIDYDVRRNLQTNSFRPNEVALSRGVFCDA